MTDDPPPRTTLLTIGAFARATRLSIKALRLYDEIGLLPPAWTDPETGYRYYESGQLDRARLVAWLRRLDMPLTRIRHVCDLSETDRAAAAAELRDFWLRVEADTAVRRELVDFLIVQLATPDKEANMPQSTRPLEIRYAALSDRGTVRPENQDAAYAGPGLFAVADGFGEQGDAASGTAIDALRTLDAVESGDLLNVLQDAAARARHAVDEVGGDQSGTTLTALLWTGSRLGLVHIGDSRAYLLRAGGFFQITHDHTLVQSMLDEGRITPQEAESHPQRSMLVQALGGGTAAPEPQLHVTDVQPGDRYLLCTDGLSANVAQDEIRRVIDGTTDPSGAVAALVELSQRAGGTDNVACVVAHVTER